MPSQPLARALSASQVSRDRFITAAYSCRLQEEPNGATALSIAASAGNTRLVRTLLELGAKPDARLRARHPPSLHTPLEPVLKFGAKPSACRRPCRDAAAGLMTYGRLLFCIRSCPSTPQPNMRTALHAAAAAGSLPSLHLLLACPGVSVDAEDEVCGLSIMISTDVCCAALCCAECTRRFSLCIPQTHRSRAQHHWTQRYQGATRGARRPC